MSTMTVMTTSEHTKSLKKEVLEKMLKILSQNIEMIQGYSKANPSKDYSGRLANLVKERQVVAATIENDCYPLPRAPVCPMTYAATSGADTSWW